MDKRYKKKIPKINVSLRSISYKLSKH